MKNFHFGAEAQEPSYALARVFEGDLDSDPAAGVRLTRLMIDDARSSWAFVAQYLQPERREPYAGALAQQALLELKRPFHPITPQIEFSRAARGRLQNLDLKNV